MPDRQPKVMEAYMNGLTFWTEDDNDEPDDNWIAMDEPTYQVELYAALQATRNDDEY